RGSGRAPCSRGSAVRDGSGVRCPFSVPSCGGRTEFSFGCLQDQRDGVTQALPAGGFGFELAAPLAREAVELGFAAAFGGLPFGLQPAAVLQAVQRRIERALSDLERVLRDLLEALDEGVSVDGFEGGDLQNEHVERALKEVNLFMPRHSR